MDWLNYHHLLYFWTIRREGSLTRAARQLHVTHSTLSSQLRALEDYLGQDLFDRKGRRLILTPFGAEVARFADDIFRLGGELVDFARGRATPQRAILRVGVTAGLPKTIVYRLLEPAYGCGIEVSLEIRSGDIESLLGMLSRNLVQVVLSDSPPDDTAPYRVHAHLLGRTGIRLYGNRTLATRCAKGFPASLDGVPLVLPTPGSSLRRSIDRWLADRGIRANVVAEVDDAGLLRAFGAFGRGLFPVREVLAPEVEETHHVRSVGRLEGVSEAYYAISLERRIRHPLLAAVIDVARARLERT